MQRRLPPVRGLVSGNPARKTILCKSHRTTDRTQASTSGATSPAAGQTQSMTQLLVAAASAHVELSPAAPSAAGGLLLADDDAQDDLLEPAGRADAFAPGAPLALDSAGALTDEPARDARGPSISGDDAHDDVGAAGQGANQPASATGALDADEVS